MLIMAGGNGNRGAANGKPQAPIDAVMERVREVFSRDEQEDRND